jgi:hypothetical protein
VIVTPEIGSRELADVLQSDLSVTWEISATEVLLQCAARTSDPMAALTISDFEM